MEPRKRIDRSLRVALLYTVLAGLWIAASDRVLALFITDPQALTDIQTYKGWFFVVVTTLLLYVILRQDERARDQAEDAVRASEEAFRALAENNPNIVQRFDSGLVHLYINTAGVRLFHQAPAQVIGMTSRELLGDTELVNLWEERLRAVFESGAPDTGQYELNDRVYDWRLAPEFDARGSVVSVIAVSAEITERVQAERELYKTYSTLAAANQRIIGLAGQVLSEREKERQQLSRELHDDAGQALTALKLSLQMLGDDVPANLPDLRSQIDDAVELTNTTMERIRAVSQALRPPRLDALGLNASLQALCDDLAQRTRIEIHYEGTQVNGLSEAITISVYRLLQEALTNVSRHAQADQVEVEFTVSPEQVCLVVQDNGRGIEEPVAAGLDRRGLGLQGMRERVEILNGTLQIQSAPGVGTRITATLPLEAAKA